MSLLHSESGYRRYRLQGWGMERSVRNADRLRVLLHQQKPGEYGREEMATRWNGRDLEDDLAFEHGLRRRLRSKKSRAEEIVYYFELMKRIRQVAKGLSRRDDELIAAVL